jgi:dihydrofolate reductase
VDVLIMGRKTFEMAMSFSRWPYADKPVIIMSRSLSSLPAGTPSSVALSHELPVALVQRLNEAGYGHAYVDGGATIQSFLAKGLIDDMTITVVPVLLGQGIPLFGALEQDVALEMIASRAFPIGFVQTYYRVAKN